MFNSNPLKLPRDFETWFDWKTSQVTNQDYISKKKIIISDCDGILTDSKSIYSKEGKQFKTYGAYDKEMMEFMIKMGWEFRFVTDDKAGLMITFSRLNHLVKSFGSNVGYGNYGKDDRVTLVKHFVGNGYEVVFIGDSISDISSMREATWAACTANSPQVVKDHCHFVSSSSGAEGGFADLLLEIHDHLAK